jgi:hypothetical protein
MGAADAEVAFDKENVDQLPYRRELPHLVGANGLFTRIASACQTGDGHRLVE